VTRITKTLSTYWVNAGSPEVTYTYCVKPQSGRVARGAIQIVLPMKTGIPGASPLGTWDTSALKPACPVSRPLQWVSLGAPHLAFEMWEGRMIGGHTEGFLPASGRSSFRHFLLQSPTRLSLPASTSPVSKARPGAPGDYNEQRPHSSLNYRTPAEFARQASYGKDVGSAHFENADGVSNFPTATAAAG
jgi:hypothetical protein